MRVIIEVGDSKKELPLVEKKFKTGSIGFHAMDKIELEGKRYQVNCLIVEIGSKSKS